MRIVAILLSLLVLPRVTLAVQGGNLVCLGTGHVEVDCHDTDDACGEPEPKPEAPAEQPDDPCIDVSAAPVSLTSRVAVDVAHAQVAWLELLPPLIAGPRLSDAHTTPDLADKSPPGFAARAFATVISPRT